MRARKAMEHFETVEEARERFTRRVAVLVAVLAAVLALAAVGSDQAATQALLVAGRASDSWIEFQTSVLQAHSNQNDAAMLRILGAGSSSAGAASQKADGLEQAVSQELQPNAEQLRGQAQALEHERDQDEEHHTLFELAETAAEIGIVLASIAILTRNQAFAVGALGLGLIGLVLLIDAETLLVPLAG